MNLQINFDKTSVTYQPGESITGNVEVYCNSNVSSAGVKMSFQGTAKVSWRESQGTGNNKRQVTRRSSETYYEVNFLVWGGTEDQVLTAGNHKFPFNFLLPLNVPGSFEGRYGRVLHECSARVIRSWRFDKKYNRPFSVNPVYNLNADERANIPISENHHKSLCCWCCKSGPISFVLRIDHSGYVCGEPVMINAECSNKSNRAISRTTAEIFQEVIFICGAHKRKEVRAVCKFERGTIRPGGDDIWSAERLVVPTVPPSGLPGCSIIDINYTLKFAMHPTGPTFALSKCVPLIIGTVPLRQVYANFFPATYPQQTFIPGQVLSTDEEFKPSAPATFHDPPPAYSALADYPNLPPPSYSASILAIDYIPEADASGSESESAPGESASTPFAPMYPTYHFPQPPP